MEIDNLNKYQIVYLTYKIFDYWNNGNIIYNNKKILPSEFNIFNINDILKVYLICSKIDKDKYINKIMRYFKKINIYEKLDFMIYLFDMVNDIDIIPNYLTNNLNLKDLSNKLIEYKLSL
jgi:hypothetical protein